jgi:hypothetical protein
MEEHIEKCIKSTASQRRLRTVFNLRASAIGTNPELCQSQAAQTTTLLLFGTVGLESVLASIVTNALARYPGLEVAFEQVNFGRTPETNTIRMFVSGPADHLKGAVVRVQTVSQVYDKVTMRLFDGHVADAKDAASAAYANAGKETDDATMGGSGNGNGNGSGSAPDSGGSVNSMSGVDAASSAHPRSSGRVSEPESSGSGGEGGFSGADSINSASGPAPATTALVAPSFNNVANNGANSSNSSSEHPLSTYDPNSSSSHSDSPAPAATGGKRRASGLGLGDDSDSGNNQGVAAPAAKTALIESASNIEGAVNSSTAKLPVAATGGKSANGKSRSPISSSEENSDDSTTSGTSSSYDTEERDAIIRLHGDFFSNVRGKEAGGPERATSSTFFTHFQRACWCRASRLCASTTAWSFTSSR